MHPVHAAEYVIEYIHVNDQEFVEVVYFADARLDSNFSQRSLFTLIKPLNDHASMLGVVDSQPNQ